MPKEPQTLTVGGTTDCYTLVRDTPRVNDEHSNEDEVFTPFVTTVHCSFFPYTYNVSSDVGLATTIAAHVLAKVKEADKSIEPDKFELGFHHGVTKTLTIFKPSVLLSQYGFTDPTTMTLAIGRKLHPRSKTKVTA